MASNIPPVQRALIQSPTPGVLEFTTTRPVPELQDGQVLIRVAAVAISPWDWKTSLHFAVPGAGVGSDFSGTVVQLGPGAQKANPDLEIGDRVAGGSFGANPLNLQEGAFAEYIAGWADQVWRVPNDMGFADAASLGFGSMGAVALAVLHEEHLGLPGTPEHPVAGATEPPPWVLVHGGSTATGTLAIQFVKQSGYRVVTTCSPANFDLVKSYGADAAFDYRAPDVTESIRELTSNRLMYAMDIITIAKTLRLCYASIGRLGGKCVGFEKLPDDVEATRATVKASWVMAPRLFGRDIALGEDYSSPADPELRVWGCDMMKRLEALIWAGKLRPHPVEVNETDSFDGIPEGLARLRKRAVSGKRLVYLIL